MKEFGKTGWFLLAAVLGGCIAALLLFSSYSSQSRVRNGENSHIAFALVGDGALREELQKKADERHLKNVVFTVCRSKQKMPDWIASSDVNQVHLGKTDLFTAVMTSGIFESAGCARSMISGLEDFAKRFVLDAEAGLPMESENAEKLVSLLKQLYNDSALCDKFGKNGFGSICRKYNRNQQAEDYSTFHLKI